MQERDNKKERPTLEELYWSVHKIHKKNRLSEEDDDIRDDDDADCICD